MRRYGRVESFHHAIQLFHERNGKTVVEIGSIRAKDNIDGDGYSTVCWAIHAEKVWTVDIDPNATTLTIEETANFDNVIAINDDGIEFLKNFDQDIDLLYLDGWDLEAFECEKKHLECYIEAYKNLHEKSMVLINDTYQVGLDTKFSGKGELVIPRMIQDGWFIEYHRQNQVLLVTG